MKLSPLGFSFTKTRARNFLPKHETSIINSRLLKKLINLGRNIKSNCNHSIII